jgi:hypothetical protein
MSLAPKLTFLSLQMRRNSLYTPTACPTPLLEASQQFHQLEQIVDSKPRLAGGRLQEAVLFTDTGPGSRHGAELAVAIEIHHTVLAPIQTSCDENEFLADQRMERMSDAEDLRRLIVGTTRS